MASRKIFARRLPLALSLVAMLVVASAETPPVNAGMELSEATKIEQEAVKDILLDQRKLEQPSEPKGGDSEGKETEQGGDGDADQNQSGDGTENEADGETPDTEDKDAKKSEGAKEEEAGKPSGEDAAEQEIEQHEDEQKQTEAPEIPGDDDNKAGDGANSKSESNNQNDETDQNNSGNNSEPAEEDKKTEETNTEKEDNKISMDTGWDPDEEGGGFLIVFFVVLVGLGAFAFKRKEKVLPIVQDFIAQAKKGFASETGGAATSTKYQQVASEETNDEEWGWGDDNNNGANSVDDDDDDWGDDDWGDDLGTSTSKKDIEMTTPSFSTNNSYNDTHLHRRPSSGDEAEPVVKTSKHAPPTKSMSLTSKINSGGKSKSYGSPPPSRPPHSSVTSTAISTTTTTLSPTTTPAAPMPMASGFPQDMPGTLGGMTMGITSLGPKKAPTAVTKPKKKKLMGASDDDLFASMGFGGPPSKPKPKATLPKKFATVSTPAFASKPAAPKPVSKPFVAPKPVVSAPAPALIPDGFGDDDDLGLDDDDLGFGDDLDTGGGGDDDWGDDDDDLDDLLGD